MRTKTSFIFLIALLATVLNASALSLEELAGVYDCKRTERFSDEIRRYNETIVIRPDGYFLSYIEVDGTVLHAAVAQLAIDEDGNMIDDEGNVVTVPRSKLTLRGKGKHLEVDVLWPASAIPGIGEVTITIKGQRTDGSWEDWAQYFPE